MWQKCIERAQLAQGIMTQLYNCETPHLIYMNNATKYWITARGGTRLDGARASKQVWHPHVRTWGLSETNVLYWSSILVTLLAPPQSTAPGELCPLHPRRYARDYSARSDAPQQTMVVLVLSSNQRHEGIFGFGRQNFQFALIFAPLWRKE